MHFGIIFLVLAVTFVAELPDKTMFTSLILSRKFRAGYVWLGAASAMLVHVIIAVLAGHALSLLPSRILHLIVAALFLVGSLLIFFGKHGVEEATHHEPKAHHIDSPTFWKIYGASFTLVFLGEWGDITQITTANYAAHFHDAISVGIGAGLGLWAAVGVAVLAGSRVLSRIPVKLFQRTTGTILLIFALVSFFSA